MLKKLLFLSVVVFCISCANFGAEEPKVWVYMEAQTILKKDTTNAFLYGQIKQSIIEKMQGSSQANGLFFIKNTRFINDDDQLQIYADENDSGILAYRIENVKTLEVLERDPILSFDEADLAENSKQFLAQNKSDTNSVE